MFVTIIRGDCRSTYECTSMHTNPIDGKPNSFLLTLRSKMDGAQERLIEIDKTVPEKLEVYMMNSLGQTVDRVFMKAENEN